MAGFECGFVEKPPQEVQFECSICLPPAVERASVRECSEPMKINN
jgi:hypothetical protein